MATRTDLASLPLFAGLPPDQLRLLEQVAVRRRFEAGQVIVRASEQLRSFYVLSEGRVKIFRSSPEGREQTFFVFGPGEPFCFCRVFSDEGFYANATALTEGTLLVFPGEVLEALARQEPSLLFNFLVVMSRRLKEAFALIESLSFKEIPERVAAFLVVEAREGDTVTLPMTHRELAKIVGATPEALSRALRKMEKAGVVEVEGRRFRILDREKLLQLAGE